MSGDLFFLTIVLGTVEVH
ncbi:BnaC02g32880D [Brassica napus]|uniref:BnaC02g32880D protein n=1 Tax=Brassica napus TaxID=3708 RepID=A0A078I0J5_BRANA|nr:BnaC02g32880D [Brassica napus]